MSIIQNLQTQAEIRSALSVIQQLRPHLKMEGYLQKVQLLKSTLDWQLSALIIKGQIVCVASYRISNSLGWDKFLYIDDLVTDEAHRSKGYGKQMLDWLKAEAKRQGCAELHLDSWTQRLKAHDFYKREGIEKVGFHFSAKL